MFEDFPYSNLHQLNLDWLVDVVEKLHDNLVISVNGQTGEVILYQNATMQLPNVDDRTWTIIRNTHGVKRGIKFDQDGTAYIVSGNSLASVFTPENPPASSQVTYDQYVRLTTLTGEQLHNWNIFRTLNDVSTGIEFDDTGEAYIISGSNRYRLYSTKNPNVSSVNGQTGDVVLYTDSNGEMTLPGVTNPNVDAWSIGRTINGTACRIYIYDDGQVTITAGNDEYRLVNSEELDDLAGEVSDLKSAFTSESTILEDAVFTKGSAITAYRTAAGYRYDSIGQASATRDDNYHVQFFAVTDDEYYINTAADSFCAFSTNDSTGNTFGQAYVGYSGLVKKPSTANYFVVSKKKTDSTTCIKPIVSNIDSLESETAQLGTAIADTYKKVYAVKTDNIEVGWINTSGVEKETGNYHRTDYIPIKNGESLKYKLSHGTTQPIIAYYNTSKVYDNSKSVIGENGYSEGTYTATADGFLRFVYLDARDDVYVKFTDVIPDNVRLLIKSASLGEINILLMGDSIFGNDGEIAGFLNEKYTSCVNGAFGGTRVTDRGGSDNFQYFDGVNIINALCTQTWTDQDAAATALSSSYPWITGRLAGLKAVDMSKVDVLIMDWGTNDYTTSATIEQINTAYESVIDMLQTAFPSLHILITTPIWRYFSSSENGDNKVFNVSTLKEIALAIEQMAKNKRITVFNAYQNIPLSYATASTYFDSGDSTHLNTAGNEVYAGYLSGMIKLILG